MSSMQCPSSLFSYLRTMAFRPRNNQKFYLSVKQKGKVTGTSDTAMGRQLQLLDYKASDAKQIFRFDFGEGFYWLKFPEYDRYVAVNAASQDNNVPLISWEWQSGSQHLMFEFISAGGGYYRIRARHSGKYLEMADGKLVQNALKETDNQLFYPVLVPEESSAPAIFYTEQSDLERTIYLALIGKIPEAGEALAFIVGYFWKEKDKMGDFWGAMKNYVDARIRQLILEKQIEFLKDEFTGYLNLLAEIKFSLLPKKGVRIQSVIDNMVIGTPHFTNKPVEVLPMLVAYGTVLIVLRRTLYDAWNDLFDIPETPAIKLSNYGALISTISEFDTAVQKSRAEYMKWRLAQIPDARTISPSGIGQSIMTDQYEGITHAWLDPHKAEGTPDHLQRAQFATEQRRAIAKVQFTAALDELTRAARFWKYFNPAIRMLAVKTRKTVGIFGGMVYSASTFSMPDSATFDRIDFYSGGSLCGLELFAGGTTYGLLGSSSGQKETLQLGAGEYINSVYGYAKDRITGLWMTTTKGRKSGAGAYGGNDYFFTADLPDSFKAKLHGISGAYKEMLKDNLVMQLSFRWEYDDYE